jgi:type IV pilus assembly protein PilX
MRLCGGINPSMSLENRHIRKGVLKQDGMALVLSLILLLAISMLGLSAAQIAIEEDKASRNDRDRKIALQAAEAALLDAEADIDGSTSLSGSRSHIFSKNSALGFPEDGEPGCNGGEGNRYLGLCSQTKNSGNPSWLTANLAGDAGTASNAVTYGAFTGSQFQTGHGTLPVKLPRYVIELMLYSAPGENADQVSYFYRITAIGFGVREETKVVLQTLYRKES